MAFWDNFRYILDAADSPAQGRHAMPAGQAYIYLADIFMAYL